MKLCIDCAHFEANNPNDTGLDRCLNSARKSLVDGSLIYFLASYARSEYGKCGEDAALFRDLAGSIAHG